MVLLRKAGSIVEETFPGDENASPGEKTKIGLRVLNAEEYESVQRAISDLQKNRITDREAYKRVLGLGIHYIDNLRIASDDGSISKVELKKDDRNRLTDECLDDLIHAAEPLWTLIANSGRVTDTDVGNY